MPLLDSFPPAGLPAAAAFSVGCAAVVSLWVSFPSHVASGFASGAVDICPNPPVSFPSAATFVPSLPPGAAAVFASVTAAVDALVASPPLPPLPPPPAASAAAPTAAVVCFFEPAPTTVFLLTFLGLPLPRLTTTPAADAEEEDPLPFVAHLRPAVPFEGVAVKVAVVEGAVWAASRPFKSHAACSTRPPERRTFSCISSTASLTLWVLGGQETLASTVLPPPLPLPSLLLLLLSRCPSKARHLFSCAAIRARITPSRLCGRYHRVDKRMLRVQGAGQRGKILSLDFTSDGGNNRLYWLVNREIGSRKVWDHAWLISEAVRGHKCVGLQTPPFGTASHQTYCSLDFCGNVTH